MNPMDPGVRAWFVKYMHALLRTFGDVIDGFVWDETFYIRPEQNAEAGGYAAQSFLTLVEELTAIVHEYNASKVFLASDIPLFDGPTAPAPAYSMVADGNFAN